MKRWHEYVTHRGPREAVLVVIYLAVAGTFLLGGAFAHGCR